MKFIIASLVGAVAMAAEPTTECQAWIDAFTSYIKEAGGSYDAVS